MALLLQSCKCNLNMVFLPKLTAQEGSLLLLLLFYFLSCHKPSFIFWPPLSSPGLQLSTRDGDDVTEKQGSPSPLIRHDLLGFFISLFVPRHPTARSRTAGGLDQHRSVTLAWEVENKAQYHGNSIKSTLKLIYLQKQWILCWLGHHLGAFILLFLCFLCRFVFLTIPYSILVGEGGRQSGGGEGTVGHALTF